MGSNLETMYTGSPPKTEQVDEEEASRAQRTNSGGIIYPKYLALDANLDKLAGRNASGHFMRTHAYIHSNHQALTPSLFFFHSCLIVLTFLANLSCRLHHFWANHRYSLFAYLVPLPSLLPPYFDFIFLYVLMMF